MSLLFSVGRAWVKEGEGEYSGKGKSVNGSVVIPVYFYSQGVYVPVPVQNLPTQDRASVVRTHSPPLPIFFSPFMHQCVLDSIEHPRPSRNNNVSRIDYELDPEETVMLMMVMLHDDHHGASSHSVPNSRIHRWLSVSLLVIHANRLSPFLPPAQAPSTVG